MTSPYVQNGGVDVGESGLSSSRSYQYDLDGNRTRKVEGATTIDYAYDRTDQLTSQTIAGVNTVYSYTEYGDLTQSGNSVSAVTGYTYGTGSQLKTINAPGTTQDVALTLDALGRFKDRTVNGVTDSYGYLGSSETVTAIVGATSRVSALAADGSRVATKEGSTTGFLLPDLHGNVAAVEQSASSAIAVALRYDGYGQTLGSPYTGGGAITMDAKYQGRLDLSATSDPLYDMSARFYAPGLGTFTQLDSVLGSAQNPLSMNRFLYAEANPTTFIDPTGHYVMEGGGGSTRCAHIGDSGCGRTAATSRSKVRPAARRAQAPRSPYHGNGRGATWRDSGPGGAKKTDGFEADRTNRYTSYIEAQNAATQRDHDNDVLGGIVSGVWNGTIGGVIQIGGHIATNLDKIPTGVQVLIGNPTGSIDALRKASGFDDPIKNLGQGWDAMLNMSNHDKAEFWSAIVAGTVIGAKAPKLLPGRAGPEAIDVARTAATTTADLAQAGGRGHGVAAGLVTRTGDIFSEVSGRMTHHPLVQAALDAVPEGLRTGFHGKCAEMACLTRALDAGVDPSGGRTVPVNIRPPGDPVHGTYRPPCSSCQEVLRVFDVDW